MLNKGFNITKSCVQNDFHQNWEFKFKLKINWKKGIQIRLMPRENEDKNKLIVHKKFSLK